MHAKYINERPALGVNGGWNPPLRIIGGMEENCWDGRDALVRAYDDFMGAHPSFNTNTFAVMELTAFIGRSSEPVKVVVKFCLAEPFHADTDGTMEWRSDIASKLFNDDSFGCGPYEEAYAGMLLVTCPESLAGLQQLMERKLAKFKEDKLAYYKGVLGNLNGQPKLEANYAYMKDIVEELENL